MVPWDRRASITMEAASAATAGEGLPLPGGPVLRLLLLHVFTAALQGGSAAVEVGSDAAALASSLGMAATPRRLKELAEQSEYLVKARMLHLTERFFASLQQGAVALDRGVVAALAGSALALAGKVGMWRAA